MSLSESLAQLDAVIADAEAKASRIARAYFKSCSALWGGHEYLRANGIETPLVDSGTLRVDAEAGLLVAPILKNGVMVSVQLIDVEGKREPWPLIPELSGYFLSHAAPQSMTVLTSSLATGLLCVGALRSSAKPARCYVAWGGLDDVVPDVSGFLVICADKGEGAAADRMAAITGAGIAIPSGCIGTDWCDWRREKIAGLSANPGRKTPTMLERDTDASLSLLLSKAAKYVAPSVGLSAIPKQNGSRSR